MRKAFVFIAFLFMAISASASDTILNITPIPVSLQYTSGTFKFNHSTRIICNKASASEASYLKDQLHSLYGWDLIINIVQMSDKGIQTSNGIVLNTLKKSSQEEEYTLDVKPGQISISAGATNGLFYGIQSLLQLLPTEKSGLPVHIPGLEIKDHPRFKYRGMH